MQDECAALRVAKAYVPDGLSVEEYAKVKLREAGPPKGERDGEEKWGRTGVSPNKWAF